MKRTAGIGTLVALAAMLAFTIATHGCGGDDDRRDRERCDVCDPLQVDSDCVHECLRFCAEGEPDCAGRCNRECDRCKAELECRTCTSGCTGTTARCAPADEPLVCEDGTF